jgi:hypothetical protein
MPMSKRPITALLAALALLAVTCTASLAQSPTPTATAAQDDGTAADPPADASKEVKAVYKDYSGDGVIDVCDHTREVLQETLDGIEAAFDRDFPDFREAVKAGIQRHDKGKCDDDAEPTATATAEPTESATAEPTETASPDDGTLPPPEESSTPDDGALPPTDDGGSSQPPEDGTLPPAETITPVPTPTPTPPEAAITPAPSPTPAIVTRSSTGALLVPGILVGLALLGGLALAFAAISGRSPRTRHAFNEAAYRAKGTWADFSDWLKFGR